MTSKVSGTDTRNTPVGASRAVERVRDVVSQPKTAGQAPEGVHITGTARQLVELEKMVKDLPAVDEARVAAITAALEQGTYKVSAEKIAEGFIQIEQALAPLTEKR